MLYRDYYNAHKYLNDVDTHIIADISDEWIRAEYEELGRIFLNAWISEANEDGIRDWELVFDIIPNLHTETLEYRRARLIDLLGLRPPFTEHWLYNFLRERFRGQQFRTIIDWRALTIAFDIPATFIPLQVEEGTYHIGPDVPRPDPELADQVARINSELRTFRILLERILPANLLLVARQRFPRLTLDPLWKTKIGYSWIRPFAMAVPMPRPGMEAVTAGSVTKVAYSWIRPFAMAVPIWRTDEAWRKIYE